MMSDLCRSKRIRKLFCRLQDGSRWCIWPPDMYGTLQWSPSTNLNVIEIDDNFSTHALIDQDGRSARMRDPETNAWLSDRGRVRSTPFQGELSPPRFEEPLEALAVDDVYPV